MTKEASARWYAKNRERQQAKQAAYRARPEFKEEQRRRNLRYNYSISIERWNEMLEEQNGVCALCLLPMDQPFVDHCHETKVVRGLLHSKCNTALSMFGDNPERLRRAADYVERVYAC